MSVSAWIRLKHFIIWIFLPLLDVDECKNNPCTNAVSCQNLIGDYQCKCQKGWSGKNCDHNINDCIGQCQHGATCIDLVSDYHCACMPGYTGRDCATDIDECDSNPCRNGGECVDLVDGYRCICPVGYSGSQCEVSNIKHLLKIFNVIAVLTNIILFRLIEIIALQTHVKITLPASTLSLIIIAAVPTTGLVKTAANLELNAPHHLVMVNYSWLILTYILTHPTSKNFNYSRTQ